MINYTERLTLLMQDIVTRVEPLSFIDPASLLVFARFGRSGAEGAYATCHCLCLPQAEPGYYFWRDRVSGEITRRSEWFLPRTPDVRSARDRLDYLISFALPRFCDQRLERSRKRVHYPAGESWLAKLDTVVHELYHIDPQRTGIRQMVSDDGRLSQRCHSDAFFSCVAELVQMYLDTRPDPGDLRFPARRLPHARRAGTAPSSARRSATSRRIRRSIWSRSATCPISCRQGRGIDASIVPLRRRRSRPLHGSRSRPARVPRCGARGSTAHRATRPR